MKCYNLPEHRSIFEQFLNTFHKGVIDQRYLEYFPIKIQLIDDYRVNDIYVDKIARILFYF